MSGRVAVLGAGFQGCCVALELARRGVSVDLYDREDRCITQAGFRNEGKIHLGLVYANDPTFTTARVMVRGALEFGSAVRRWIERDLGDVCTPAPFDYVVHRDSMVSPETVAAHFATVDACLRETASATCLSYLDDEGRTPCYRTASRQVAARYDRDTILTVSLR